MGDEGDGRSWVRGDEDVQEVDNLSARGGQGA